jgi:hypothetical protein
LLLPKSCSHASTTMHNWFTSPQVEHSRCKTCEQAEIASAEPGYHSPASMHDMSTCWTVWQPRCGRSATRWHMISSGVPGQKGSNDSISIDRSGAGAIDGCTCRQMRCLQQRYQRRHRAAISYILCNCSASTLTCVPCNEHCAGGARAKEADAAITATLLGGPQ